MDYNSYTEQILFTGHVKNYFEKDVGSMVVVTLKASDRGAVVSFIA